MTPEEQDVYAMMGVSPLVVLNRQVKNPKSAIINVVLPGQAAKSRTVESIPASEPQVEPEQLPEPATEEFAMSEQLNLLVQPPEELSTTPSPILPIAVVEPESESPSEESVTRRRRRRSSATKDND